MRIVLVLLLLLLVVGGAGVGGWYWLQQQPGAEDKVFANASASSQPDMTFGIEADVKTQPDIADALNAAIKKNSDTIAWLRVPETDINNSVLHSFNNEYYLRINERKEADIYGCYFADYECNFGPRAELSENTVIYGHSDLKDNPDGPRFSQLFRFAEEDFAKATPYIYFCTQDDYMVWQVFSVAYTDTSFQYIHPNLEPAQFTDLVTKAKALSLYDYAIEVAPGDKVLTLSTCSVKYGAGGNNRLVVMAKLLPADTVEAKEASFTVK